MLPLSTKLELITVLGSYHLHLLEVWYENWFRMAPLLHLETPFGDPIPYTWRNPCAQKKTRNSVVQNAFVAGVENRRNKSVIGKTLRQIADRDMCVYRTCVDYAYDGCR